MKKLNQFGLVVCSVFAILMYLTQTQKKTIDVINQTINDTAIEVILKTDKNQLIPFTIESACTTELECLNEAVFFMSNSHDEFNSTLPKKTKVLSLACNEQCVVDFSSELLEFDPAEKAEVELVLSSLLQDYEASVITVAGQPTEKLSLHEDAMLNQTHFINADIHHGYLYQMYMSIDTDTGLLILPVVIHSNSDDFISVMENYYKSSSSVQFDTVNFRKIELIEGNPLQLHLSSECIVNHQLIMDKVMPVLLTIKEVYPNETVQIIVEDVVVDEITLSELRINEFLLSE